MAQIIHAVVLAAVAITVPATAAPKNAAKKSTAGGSNAPPPNADTSDDDEWTPQPAETAPDGRVRDPELGEPPVTKESDPEQRPSPLTPRPGEMPARPGEEATDLSALLGELVALRARVNALTATLYESKLRISLEADGEDVRIAALTVTVDGGIVYRAPERFVGAEESVVYEHVVAPGRHVIGVEIERFDPQAKAYRAWQATRYAVEVPEKKVLSARIELEDDSSMHQAASGRYRSKTSMRVEVIEP